MDKNEPVEFNEIYSDNLQEIEVERIPIYLIPRPYISLQVGEA